MNNVTGFFGQRPVNVPAGDVTLDLGSISEFTSGFTMTDPSLTFLVRNGMGVSMGIDLDLDGINSDGDISQLNPSPFEIAQSTVPGTMVSTNVRLDKTNSSIVQFLDALPSSLIYSGQMSLNPSNTGGVTNFLSRQDVLQLGLEIDLPLELGTSNLRFENEVEMDLTEDDSLIDFLSLGFRSENDFPLDLNIKLFFPGFFPGGPRQRIYSLVGCRCSRRQWPGYSGQHKRFSGGARTVTDPNHDPFALLADPRSGPKSEQRSHGHQDLQRL